MPVGMEPFSLPNVRPHGILFALIYAAIGTWKICVKNGLKVTSMHAAFCARADAPGPAFEFGGWLGVVAPAVAALASALPTPPPRPTAAAIRPAPEKNSDRRTRFSPSDACGSEPTSAVEALSVTPSCSVRP